MSEYKAISDSDTLFNPTNHTYFNLNGFDGSNILNQEIQIFDDYYTWSNDAAIPDGRILPVEGTPMDLRKLTTIGRHIDADFDELNYGHGYDHNWCINIVGNECISVLGSPLYRAAHAESKSSGIALTVHTDMPGIQFYTGNFLDGNLRGKNGVRFRHRQGFCLETQYYPNAVNNAKFPQPVLSGSIEWSSKTLYSIGRKLETKISDE